MAEHPDLSWEMAATLPPNVYKVRKKFRGSCPFKHLKLCSGWCGLHDSTEAASAAVAEHVKQEHKKRKYETPGIEVMDLHQYTSWADVFTDFIPGDLETTYEAQLHSQKMFKADPIYKLLSVAGEWGPWKVQLRNAWCQHSVPDVKTFTKTTCRRARYWQRTVRAAGALQVLRTTVQAMNDGAKDAQVWADNIDRNKKVPGWLKAMEDLGVVDLQGSGPPLKLGGQSTACRLSDDKNDAISKLRALAAVSDVLETSLKLLARPPTSTAKWRST